MTPSLEAAWGKIRSVDPSRFNRAMAAISLLILSTIVAVRTARSPREYFDFPQYYVAGLMVRLGHAGALYPLPNPQSPWNAGYPEGSSLKPQYSQIARQYGVPVDAYRFIQPPQAAMLYEPLTLLPIQTAHYLFLGLLTLCGWWAAIQGGECYESLIGRPSIGRGWLVFLISTSPLMFLSVRIGNTTLLTAPLFGAAVNGILRRRDARAGLGSCLGFVLKIFPGSLMLVAIVAGRWRTLAWFVASNALLLTATIAIIGIAPCHEFATSIVPTLSRPTADVANQSLAGFLLALGHHDVLSSWTLRILGISRWAAESISFIILWRRRHAVRAEPQRLIAGAALILAIIFIFSPLTWTHYTSLFFPLSGWIAWEARQRRSAAIAAVVVAVLTWFPIHVALHTTHVPEPFASLTLWALLLIAGLAFFRVIAPTGDQLLSGILVAS
ncbi:MAG: glycosyltransferase family 87 protein [Tepidisphaeraceae bacterium]|jgi:hypothetical protein